MLDDLKKKEEKLYWKEAYLRLSLKAIETYRKLKDPKLKKIFLEDAKIFGDKAKGFG